MPTDEPDQVLGHLDRLARDAGGAARAGSRRRRGSSSAPRPGSPRKPARRPRARPRPRSATMPPNPGWRTRSTAGCSRSRPASSRALAWARSTRRCSVRSPRSASQTSIGPAMAPWRVRWVSIRSWWARPASVRGGDDGAEQHVAVAGQVLGHRVHDDVGAELERALEQGRGEGVVDHAEHAALAGGGQQRRQVGDLEQRVGRRLEPEQVGAVEGGQHRLGVGDVDPAHRGRAFGLTDRERGERGVVRGIGRDDGAAVGEQGEGRRHGRHTRGDSTSASPPSRSPSAASKADQVGLPERA